MTKWTLFLYQELTQGVQNMKKTIAVLCLFILLIFTGCSESKSTFKSTDVKNVSISISDVSPAGAIVTIKDINEEPYVYGEWYKIEEKKNGEWFDVKTIIDNYGFTEIGYLTDANGKVKFEIDWQWLYGELPKGSYRLLKEVNHQYISVEFSID